MYGNSGVLYQRERELADSADLPFTPDDRDLVLSLRCYTSRTSTEYDTHPLVLHADGSVDLPHDLDAERVAAAFGAFSSCRELVDYGIPAARALLPLLSRRGGVPLRRDARGRWRPPRALLARCCTGQAFTDPAGLLEHLRDAWHARLAYAVPHEPILRALLEAIEAAWAAARDTTPAARILEGSGLDDLWRAGIAPDDIADLARPADAVAAPLPAAYFVAMRYGNADPDWFATVIAARPDGDFAAWLAAQDAPQSRGDAHAWAAWLRRGLTTTEVDFAVSEGIDPSDADAVCEATAWPAWLGARTVVRWSRAGCRITADHAVALARHGLEHTTPAAKAIDALIADLTAEAVLSGDVSRERRTDLALLLTVLGTRRDTIHAVRSGVTSIAALPGSAAANPATTSANPVPASRKRAS